MDNIVLCFNSFLLNYNPSRIVAIIAGIVILGYTLGRIKFLTPMLWIFNIVFHFFIQLNQQAFTIEAHNFFIIILSGVIIVSIVATLTVIIKQITIKQKRF